MLSNESKEPNIDYKTNLIPPEISKTNLPKQRVRMIAFSLNLPSLGEVEIRILSTTLKA